MRQLTNIFRNSKLLQIQVLVVLLSTIISCNFNDPSIETLASYNFYYYNSGQISVGGEYLKDSIYVQVYNQQSPNDVSDFTVKFEVIKGGGKVDQEDVKTNKKGKAGTRWKLGTESFKQIVKAKVTDREGNVYPESQITGYGMLQNNWNAVDYQPLTQLSDLASDTIGGQSWMITISKVYKRGQNFLDWQQLSDPKLNGAREIEIDKNGVIYIGTWYGELYKSTDHGQTWIKCMNPIPDRPYYFYFWVTDDGDLWATQYERGLWHSKDGGITWMNPVKVSSTNFYMNGNYRLKNGWLVSLIAPTGQRSEVMKSEDEGKTWTALTTPNYPYSIFVTENDEIIVFTQTNAGIYKSNDFGKTFKQVHSGSVAFNTGSMQTYVHKFGHNYFMAIPGFGVLKSQNFETFENILKEPNIGGIYIDHTGSVFLSGQPTFVYNTQ